MARRSRLREILAAHLGCCPRAIEFRHGQDGRPKLEGLHFSLSSTGDLAALALSRNGPLGLDIEAVGQVDAATLSRSLSPGERAALEALPEGERARAFCRAWTRKEAYLKARGVGLRVDPRSCEVTIGPAPGLLACASGEAGRWTLRSIEVAPGIEGALCLAAPERR